MFKPSQRLADLPPYIFSKIARDIRELSVQGHDIIRLDIGSPDGMPPPHVIEALTAAAHRSDVHGYSAYNGTPAFRQAMARFYERRFGVTVDPDTQVLPLIGSKEGLANLCFAFLDSGDVALVPDIGYPVYARGALLAGASVYWLPLREQNGFLFDLVEVPADVAQCAKMLWVNYPNNPTGAVADLGFYRQTVDFCNEHSVLLVCDNPYHDLTFDGYRAGSVLQISGALQCSVELISFSKSYNMGGWRLGAAVGNADVLKILLQMKSNVDTGHFAPVYEAGVAALEHTSEKWGKQRNSIYQRRRDVVVDVFSEIGFQVQVPRGAMYVWARVTDGNGYSCAESLLNKAHVSVTPGGAFGPGGDEYVRISLGVPDDRLELAVQRLRAWHKDRA